MTRVGIDIGGTFTDVVVETAEGVRVAKVSSTPDPADGFILGLGLADAGGDCSDVRHGTTVATNAVIQRNGARLAFLATEGFRHILHLARQSRTWLYDVRASRPEPLVDLQACIAVPERLGPRGEVIRALDVDELRSRLEPLRGLVDGVAIVLLHSYADPVHERLAADVVADILPGVSVSVSSDVLPEFREYERASTTVLNAFVQPVLSRYLGRIASAAGDRRLGVMWSGGGIRDVAATMRLPVHTMLSGPAAGVLGAVEVAGRAGCSDIVTLDMGGTSADVAIVDGGRPVVASSADLEGLPFATPCLDIVSVGAGGGSICWLDEGGALRVGPRSAGAVPGPASYGRGGVEPTVTDAHVVAGHLGGELAGGELTLDAGAAREAVAALASAAGLGVEETADGILRVVRATMARAIRSVSVERGKDVRGYALVAFGGAGALHGVALARDLGMETVIVPPSPGTLAALGLLVASRRAEVSRTRPMVLEATALSEASAVLRELGQQARAELEAEGVRVADVSYAIDCRFVGQSHELRVDANPEAMDDLLPAFAGAHRARYGFSRSGTDVEAVTFRAVAAAARLAPSLPRPPADGEPQVVGTRRVSGADVAVLARGSLAAGRRIPGPAIVQELDATTWIDAGATAAVHDSGALMIEV